jgi:hypothetical protein
MEIISCIFFDERKLEINSKRNRNYTNTSRQKNTFLKSSGSLNRPKQKILNYFTQIKMETQPTKTGRYRKRSKMEVSNNEY